MDRNPNSGSNRRKKSRSKEGFSEKETKGNSQERNPPNSSNITEEEKGRGYDRDRPNKNSSEKPKEIQNSGGSSRSFSRESSDAFGRKIFSNDEDISRSINESYSSGILISSLPAKLESIRLSVRSNKDDGGSKHKHRRYNRGRAQEIKKESFDKESEEYKFFSKLSVSYSKIRRNKWNTRDWGPRPTNARRGEEDHYPFWRNAYDSHLWEIFDRVAGRINKFKNCSGIEIDFNDFVDFAYEFSSGYITPYS